MTPRDLARLQALSQFTALQLDQLAACAEQREVAPGAVVFRHGDPGREIFVLASGEVRMRRLTRLGECELGRLGPGEIFGELGFVDGQPRSGDAVAATAGTLVALDATALRRAADADPRFELALVWALWKGLSAKLRGANQQLPRFFPDALTAGPRAGRGQGPDSARLDLSARRDLFARQTLTSLESSFLASLAREERYGPRQTIFREGDVGDRMFLVADGEVVITKAVTGAGEEALAVLAPGSFFGEMALIDGAPRSADARAHDAGAVVLAISQEVLSGVLNVRDQQRLSSARLLKRLAELAASRLREIDERITGWAVPGD